MKKWDKYLSDEGRDMLSAKKSGAKKALTVGIAAAVGFAIFGKFGLLAVALLFLLT